MIKRAIILLMAVNLVSCAPGLMDDLTRSADNPSITSPRTDSFGEAGIITVSWEEDECADEYVLYRSPDGAIKSYDEVYRGTGLSYRDSNLIEEERYLYILYKIRGSESFGPSPSVMGVCSSTEQDVYEPNESYSDVTSYESSIIANCYGYNSNGNAHYLLDYDYYSVSVSPGMVGKYNIEMLNQKTSIVGATGLKYQKRTLNAESMPNPVELAFTNDTNQRKTFYFSVFIDKDNVCNDINGGGNMISYEVSYVGESLPAASSGGS